MTTQQNVIVGLSRDTAQPLDSTRPDNLLNPSAPGLQFKVNGWLSSNWLFFSIPGILLILGFALPLLVLIWRGLTSGFLHYLSNQSFLAAISLSLQTSFLAALATIGFGTPLAYWLARRPLRHKAWLELIIDLPVVMPPLIAGIALLLAFGRSSPLGAMLDSAGIRLPFTTAAVVMAQMFVSAPLYIRSARLGFASVSGELVEAAYTEGAHEGIVFSQIMLPLAFRAMLNGLVLCWARAFGEFGATIVFAGNMEGSTQTMPLAIFIGFESDLGLALSLSVILVFISAVVLFFLRKLEKN